MSAAVLLGGFALYALYLGIQRAKDARVQAELRGVGKPPEYLRHTAEGPPPLRADARRFFPMVQGQIPFVPMHFPQMGRGAVGASNNDHPWLASIRRKYGPRQQREKVEWRIRETLDGTQRMDRWRNLVEFPRDRSQLLGGPVQQAVEKNVGHFAPDCECGCCFK